MLREPQKRALTVDCNSRYVYADRKGWPSRSWNSPEYYLRRRRTGSYYQLPEFWQSLCARVYWQFVSAIKEWAKLYEISDTCYRNVSFYNQSSDEGPVFSNNRYAWVLDNSEPDDTGL